MKAAIQESPLSDSVRAESATSTHSASTADGLSQQLDELARSPLALALVSSPAESVWILDCDLVVRWGRDAEDTSRSVFGGAAENFIGQPALARIRAEDRPEVARALACVVNPARVATKNPSLEFRFLGLDGRERWVECVPRPFKGPRGILGVVMTLHAADDRKRLEFALHEAENTFRHLAEATGDYVVLIDRDMRTRFASRSMGLHSPMQLEGLHLKEFFPAGLSESAFDCVRRVLQTGQTDHFSMNIGAGEHSQRLEVRVSPVRRNEEVVALTLIATDMSEQFRAERAIATQARMIESMLEGVAVINEANIIEITNPSFDALFGYRRGELIGRDVAPLGIPPIDEAADSSVPATESASTPKSVRLEFEGRRREGSTFSVAGVLSRFEIAGRNHSLVVVQDVSERKQLERAILQAVNREQYRIGNDLHDGLGQELTGIALMLRSVAGRLSSEYPPLLPEIEGITKLVSNAVESTRALARGISPVNLERGGLRDALEGLSMHAAEIYGVQVIFTHRLSGNAAPGPEVSNHLYRIAQEACRNAVKHGEARIIRLHLSTVRRKVRLVIADDGSGMPQHAIDAPGLGLKIMRYRAGILGGSVRFERAEPRGARVICECPIDSEPVSAAVPEPPASDKPRRKRAAVKTIAPREARRASTGRRTKSRP